MSSNFAFLKETFPVLGNFGELAETYLYSDSNSCLMKLGMISETIVNLIFTYDSIPLPKDNTAISIKNRHVLFHTDQILINTKIIENKQEAVTTVTEVAALIEDTYKQLF